MTGLKINLSKSSARAVLECHGIVLKSHAYGESNLILRVLTNSHGKVSVVARSARASKKQFSGSFDLFDCGAFRIRRGNSSNDIIGDVIEFTPLGGFAPLRESIHRIVLGSFVCECFEFIVAEEDPHAEHAFEALKLALQAICNSVEPRSALKASFFALGTLLNQEGILSRANLLPTAKNLFHLCDIVEQTTNRKLQTKTNVLEIVDSLNATPAES